jgi:hypothetical protein
MTSELRIIAWAKAERSSDVSCGGNAGFHCCRPLESGGIR